MFRKLRIRFTLSILLVLIIFLSILSGALYMGTKTLIDSSSRNLLEESANEIIYENNMGQDYFGFPNFNESPDFFERFRQSLVFNDSKLKLSYAIYDQSLNMIYVRNNGAISFDKFEKHVLNAYKNQGYSYVIDNIEDIDYRIYTKFFRNAGTMGVLQLYQDITMEFFILNHLKKILTIASLMSAVILTIVSWFLAGLSISPVKKAWQRQKEFVADASHELRTPLSVIQTNLDAALCDKEGLISENEMWLNNAYTETQTMTKLVEELLTLAQIDADQIKIIREKINFSDICMSVIDRFRVRLNENNLELNMNIDEDVFIMADSLRIAQLITIFLDNAIKYTNRDGKIEITLKSENDYATFRITDSGMGMSQRDTERIFDRFYRADKARRRENGGTGLGLSIAKWISDNHKGRIAVDSKIDEGTTFTVEFPICK
ncbi:MAG: cell wall metabolism sensor histidine kinase WalK [Dethiosulfatibacter sp.]|nr:cell wall metabolism sensor histidine kinase WalK [Dethiosulfatibacter sp.]